MGKHRVAVAGVATTPFGSFPDNDATGLALQALGGALKDAGLDREDVRALITCRLPSAARLCELAGIDPDYVVPLPGQGRLTGLAIKTAFELVSSGEVEVCALAYGNDGRSKRVYYGGKDWNEDQDLWRAWGMTSPGAEHALLFKRHMHLYGSTTRHLAEVAVTFRNHAALNPQALMRQAITIADHETSRYVVAPLRLLDYCLINDGGAALVVTTVARARSCRKTPVEILATATAGTLSKSSFPPDDYWHQALSRCARSVYGQAQVSPSDIDSAQIYDNFTSNVLFTLEGFGFCNRGEGGPFVEGGALAVGGRLPTNTSGGHLSEGYLQGWNLNVEAVRQIRGEAGERQLASVSLVQYMAAAPLSSSIIYGVAS